MKRIEPRIVNSIISASEGQLVNVIKKYDANLTHKKGDGRNYDRGTCPFCDAVESLFINTVSEKFFCKACDFKGKGAVTYLYKGRFHGDKSKWIPTIEILADFTNQIIP